MSCPSVMLNHPYTDNLHQCNVPDLHVVTGNWRHAADQFALTLQWTVHTGLQTPADPTRLQFVCTLLSSHYEYHHTVCESTPPGGQDDPTTQSLVQWCLSDHTAVSWCWQKVFDLEISFIHNIAIWTRRLYCVEWTQYSIRQKRSAICNRCFPRPTQVLDQKGISIDSAIFAGLTRWQTDWQTDRPRYSVDNNRRSVHRRSQILLLSTATTCIYWSSRLQYTMSSATGLTQNKESSPAKDRRSTTGPQNQLRCSLIIITVAYLGSSTAHTKLLCSQK